jgi:hypothetical protein
MKRWLTGVKEMGIAVESNWRFVPVGGPTTRVPLVMILGEGVACLILRLLYAIIFFGKIKWMQ